MSTYLLVPVVLGLLYQSALAAPAVVEAELPYAEGGPMSEDPCPPGGVCLYVDSVNGDDGGSGAKDQPLKTLGDALQRLRSLPPGTHVLLRRGSTFDETHEVNYFDGAPGQRYVLGAYGPLDEPRPRINGIVTVRYSSHWMLRDLDAMSLGFFMTRHGIIFNNVVRGWRSNGIRVHGGTHYTAVVQNLVYDGNSNDAISLHDSQGKPVPEEIYFGTHHWVVDNVVIGNSGVEELIDMAGDGWRNEYPMPLDVKIINNRLQSAAVPPTPRTGAANRPFNLAHSWKYLWVIGNIGGWGNREGLYAGTGITTERQYAQISGNVFFGNGRAAISFGAADVRMTHNTIIGTVSLPTGYDSDLLGTNLILAGPDPNLGVSVPERTPYNDDPHNWHNPDFLAHFVPNATGDGPVPGAFAPDGTWQGLAIEPLAGLENNGYGWEGPLLIQARYPLPISAGN